MLIPKCFNWRIGTVFWIVLISLTQALYGGRPIPNGPDAVTYKEYRQQGFEFYRDLLNQSYAQKGIRDAKWDGAMATLIEELAHHFILVKTPRVHFEDGGNGSRYPSLQEKAGNLRQLGCEDALVYLALGQSASARVHEVEDDLREAINRLVAQDYPPILTAIASRSLSWCLKDLARADEAVKNDASSFEVMTVANLLRCINGANFGAQDQRLLATELIKFIDARLLPTPAVLDQLADEVQEQPNADPSTVQLVLGLVENDLAWRARGGGYASGVTEEGWAGFQHHLAKAADHLKTAYRLRPDRPEAATYLIVVYRGNHGATDVETDPRTWFDRAVQAQMDWKPAYAEMTFTLLPRWGGSYKQIHAFGLDCLRTQRFDTDVPYWMVECMLQIGNDLKIDTTYWRTYKVYPDVARALRGLAEHPAHEERRTYYLSMLLGFAWQCGEWREAVQLYEQLERQPDPEGLRTALVERPVEEYMLEATAKSGAEAAIIIHAEQMESDAQHAKALDEYRRALEAVGDDADSIRYIKSRMAPLLLQQELVKGEWVKLLFDENLSGWSRIAGDWKRESPTSIVGTATADGLVLFFDWPLPGAFEVRGTIEFIESPTTEFHAGPLYVQPGDKLTSPCGFLLYLHEQCLFLPRSGIKETKPQANVKQTNRFHLRLAGNEALFRLNDAEIYRGQRLRDDLYRGGKNERVGVGGFYWWAGPKIRFSDLELRLLGASDQAMPLQQ